MLAERVEPRLELRAPFGGLLDDALACVYFERLERDRGGDRMAAISEAVGEHADLFALGKQRLVNSLRDHDARDRQIGRRQCLGDRDRMRLVAELLASECRAETAETANHLV